MDDSKAPVSRGALERVLARAAQLQASRGDSPETDALTEAQVVDLGVEVGLAPELLRQALAEERVRWEPATGTAGGVSQWVFGISRIGAQRVVRGKPDQVLAALDRWMQREEELRVQRQRHDQMVWEPRQDFFSGVRRAFGGRAFALHAASETRAIVAPVDGERTVVSLEAELASARNTAMAHTATWTVLGAVGTTVLIMLGFATAVSVAPVVVLSTGVFAIARKSYERAVQRAQLALEQVLDRLERGSNDARPPSLLQMIDSAIPRLR